MVYRLLEQKRGEKVTRETMLTEEDYLFVKNHYEEKEKEFEKLKESCKVDEEEKASLKVKKLEANSTLQRRLDDAKEKYYRNECLIHDLWQELEKVKKEQGIYFRIASNGSHSKLPQMEAIEKYEKLQSTISKDITALEKELHLFAGDDEVDPTNFKL